MSKNRIAAGVGVGCGVPIVLVIGVGLWIVSSLRLGSCSITPPSKRQTCAESNLKLVRLATAGSASSVKRELRTADPDQADQDGATALACAALVGNRPAVDALLAAGANPRRTGKVGGRPIIAALSGEGKGWSLFDSPSDPGESDYTDSNASESETRVIHFTPLDSPERAKIVKALVTHGADPHPALRPACEHGNVDAVAALLDLGLDPNGEPDEASPLTTAVYSQQEPTVALLLGRGADPNHGGRLDSDRLFQAVLLLNERPPPTADSNRPATTTATSAPRSGPPLTIPAGQAEATPLAVAVFLNEPSIVDRLLAASADVDKPSFGAYPPLDAAVITRNRTLLDRLLAAGAHPRPTTPGVTAPVDVALRVGWAEAVAILQEAPEPPA